MDYLEIFASTKFCDLETWVKVIQGHSWQSSVVTMALFGPFSALLTSTLIHPVSNWTHWATLRRHPCL